MLTREKRVRIGDIELSVAMGAKRAERVRGSAMYRRVVRPAMSWLVHSDAHNADAAPIAITDRAPEATAMATGDAQVRSRISGIDWYHSIDLPGGVSTEGYVDHRRQVALYGLPDDMRGMRALDVATYDGFWAFEMERRGAEVTAIDLESLAQCDFPRRFRSHIPAATKPTGAAFRVAHELLGSHVDRRLMSVYDLGPEKVGMFDVVFLSDLLLHLRDPALALENVASVTAPDGCFILAEPYNTDLEAFRAVPLSQFGFEQAVGWWQHSSETLKTMMWAAGFDRIEEVSRFRLNCKAAIPLQKVVLKGYPTRLDETAAGAS